MRGDEVAVGLVRLRRCRVDRLLERLDHRRLVGVRLAVLAVADEAHVDQLRRRVVVRLVVAAQDVRFDFGVGRCRRGGPECR